jgi:glycerol-3-phosphate cytidylyltransferase-like family protein
MEANVPILLLELASMLFFVILLLVLIKREVKKVIITSGYFDPLHVGHIECFKLSKALGDKLVIILNNDNQCVLKKGKAFMPEREKKEILNSLKDVDEVFLSIDKDRTVCESIRVLAEKYKSHELIFTKGGDKFRDDIPEAKVCEELGIKIVDGLGEKVQFSSKLTGLNEIKK